MSLKQTIKRILKEESNKDLTSVIETLLEGIVNDHKDILCKVEVKHPDKRTKLPHSDNNYKDYRVTFYFIGGVGSVNWPMTREIWIEYESIMNNAWDLIYDYIGVKLDMFSREIKSCDETDLQESVNGFIMNENRVVDMIKELGLYDTIRYYGGYDNFISMVGNYSIPRKEKINAIIGRVIEINESYGEDENGGVWFMDMGRESIEYDGINNDGTRYDYQQIEVLYRDGVVIYGYRDKYANQDLGSFEREYEDLSDEDLDDIIKTIMT